jgi:putative Holliday junction resolvase
MVRLLALDVGSKRIGVAMADNTVKIAASLPVIDMESSDVIRKVLEMVHDHDIDKVIVGYPRNMSGEQQRRPNAMDFAEKLRVAGLR